MKQELRQALKTFKQQRKITKNFVLDLINSVTMKKCSNSLKAKQQVVQRSLMPLMSKLDGWKNCGNTLKNVKTDLTII